MRIGTWNMAGRHGSRWQQFLLEAGCHVWLLTEVHEAVQVPGYQRHFGSVSMAPNRRWAGVFSTEQLTPLSDPHTASAAAQVGDITFVSSVLPWSGSGGEPTWPGGEPPRELHAGRTRHAVTGLLNSLPAVGLVWGGDWNHALDGPEFAGSIKGRGHLLHAVQQLALKVPTTYSRHQQSGLSIDHVAVPVAWPVLAVERLDAADLSDHDGYVVEVSGR